MIIQKIEVSFKFKETCERNSYKNLFSENISGNPAEMDINILYYKKTPGIIDGTENTALHYKKLRTSMTGLRVLYYKNSGISIGTKENVSQKVFSPIEVPAPTALH